MIALNLLALVILGVKSRFAEPNLFSQDISSSFFVGCSECVKDLDLKTEIIIFQSIFDHF